MLKVFAPAKINLVLEVLGKRKDDYHEISSIITTVDLCDEISFEDSKQTSLVFNYSELPDSENLVIRAVRLLKSITGCKSDVLIKLVKKIPISAGLGGASSDAAATLKALNKLWQLNLTNIELGQIAAKLGSDVPFFIHGGTALIQGKGEKVIRLAQHEKQWFTVLFPSISVPSYKTRQLYSLLTNQHFTTGNYVTRALKAIKCGELVDVPFLFNVFDYVAQEAFPGIDQHWKNFKLAASREIHLAGSGPAMFCLNEDRHQSVEIIKKFTSYSCMVYSVSSFQEDT